MCCSSRKSRNVKREPYIDLVIGPQSYHKINDTILNYIKKKKKKKKQNLMQFLNLIFK
jgi:tRNA A37 methylthiotransferase MiaB